jgi:peroxin-3
MERSLRKIAEVVVGDLAVQTTLGSGLPLATLLPKVGHLSSPLLEEPNKNKYIQIIRSMPEVELFYTFLYANMPPET